jgi:hypothetical protein
VRAAKAAAAGAAARVLGARSAAAWGKGTRVRAAFIGWPRRCLGVWARGGDGGDGAGGEPDSNPSPVRRGEEEPDKRAPPVSARGKEKGGSGRVRLVGRGEEMGHARVRGRKKRKEERPRAGLPCEEKKRKGRGGGMADWAGPKGEKREGKERKTKQHQKAFEFELKFEFKFKSK